MIFSQLVTKLSVKFPVSLCSETNAPEIRDIAFLDGLQKVFDKDIVYFGFASQLPHVRELPLQYIISSDAGQQDTSDSHCCAIVSDKYLFAAFNLSRNIVDSTTGRGLYEELASIADMSRDIDTVLNAAAIKLGNSLVFSDSSYKIISSSTSIPVVDPLWAGNVEQGYCTYEFVSGATQLQSVKKAPYTTDTIEVTCSESPYRKLSSKVLHNGVQIGFVLMIASETPIMPVHFDMLKSVSQALTYTITNYSAYLFQGIDRYQQLLYNLLIGASAEDLVPQMSSLSLPANMVAICVRQTRYLGQKHLKGVIGEGLSQTFSGVHIAYHEGCIAGILPLESEIELSSDALSALKDFAEKNFVRIGMSFSFTHIENFSDHYRQSLVALELSHQLRQDSNVACYSDYLFFDLLSHIDNPTNLRLYCHPLLKLLRQYDHENNTELYKTLRLYVESGGSIKDTSEKLFIHRNSLIYRLGHIRELGKIDINSPYIKFILKISFDIDSSMGFDS